MNILYVMIPISMFLGISFLVAFVWATKNGQFDDVETPAYRVIDEFDRDLLPKE